MEGVSRVAGMGSSVGFILSGFRGCGTGPEAEAVVSAFKDMAVVGETIQQGGGHLGIAEHACPLAKAEVGGDDDTGLLVEFAEQMEQHCPA